MMTTPAQLNILTDLLFTQEDRQLRRKFASFIAAAEEENLKVHNSTAAAVAAAVTSRKRVYSFDYNHRTTAVNNNLRG